MSADFVPFCDHLEHQIPMLDGSFPSNKECCVNPSRSENRENVWRRGVGPIIKGEGNASKGRVFGRVDAPDGKAMRNDL